MLFLSTKIILWKNVENLKKRLFFGFILYVVVWIVENFTKNLYKLWKNGAMICLSLSRDNYDYDRFLPE